MSQVMTEKGTEELVKLLATDIKVLENNVTSLDEYLATVIATGDVVKSDMLSVKTIYANVVTAEYGRLDVVCDVYDFTNKTWGKGVLTSLSTNIPTFYAGRFNSLFAEDIYANGYVTCQYNGADMQVPLILKTDVIDGVRWHWHIDTYYGNYHIIQTPNNICETTIVSVDAWEVI